MEDTQFIDVMQVTEATKTRQNIPEIEVVQAIYAMQVIEVMLFIKATQFQEVTWVIGAIKAEKTL